MGTFKRFEDIVAWQKARELTNNIYKVSSIEKFSKDFALRDQIRRASISIMLNIAEGFARKTDKEFSQFLAIAHGSASEVQSALYIALDQKYLNQSEFDDIYGMAGEISKMVASLSIHLK